MENYMLFVLVAFVTILSPGPGVLLTLTNAIRYGFSGAIGGILGIALGSFIVAGVSATSLGVILATSTLAFSIMKYIGAAYLIYMGIKLWRSAPAMMCEDTATTRSMSRQFVEGFTMQLTNPKAVFFFMSIFPQFIHFSGDYTQQFLLLVVTYSVLVVVIHFVYAYLAKTMRSWLSSAKGGRIINRFGGGTFICFGVGLASASR
ncbi:MAG: homoserine/homoserine lactone efflux protein [Candidatus Endobugula sp.]|jgi:homoserine/homoserine lactone efflux protein